MARDAGSGALHGLGGRGLRARRGLVSGASLRPSRLPRLRKLRPAHQVPIAFACGAAAFVDRPNDQALSAPTVAGGEYARDVRGELPVLRLDVAARIGLELQVL